MYAIWHMNMYLMGCTLHALNYICFFARKSGQKPTNRRSKIGLVKKNQSRSCRKTLLSSQGLDDKVVVLLPLPHQHGCTLFQAKTIPAIFSWRSCLRAPDMSIGAVHAFVWPSFSLPWPSRASGVSCPRSAPWLEPTWWANACQGWWRHPIESSKASCRSA